MAQPQRQKGNTMTELLLRSGKTFPPVEGGVDPATAVFAGLGGTPKATGRGRGGTSGGMSIMRTAKAAPAGKGSAVIPFTSTAPKEEASEGNPIVNAIYGDDLDLTDEQMLAINIAAEAGRGPGEHETVLGNLASAAAKNLALMRMAQQSRKQQEFKNEQQIRKQAEVERAARAGEGLSERQLSEGERAARAGEGAAAEDLALRKKIGEANIDISQQGLNIAQQELVIAQRQADIAAEQLKLSQETARRDDDFRNKEFEINNKNAQEELELKKLKFKETKEKNQGLINQLTNEATKTNSPATRRLDDGTIVSYDPATGQVTETIRSELGGDRQITYYPFGNKDKEKAPAQDGSPTLGRFAPNAANGQTGGAVEGNPTAGNPPAAEKIPAWDLYMRNNGFGGF